MRSDLHWRQKNLNNELVGTPLFERKSLPAVQFNADCTTLFDPDERTNGRFVGCTNWEYRLYASEPAVKDLNEGSWLGGERVESREPLTPWLRN